MKGLETDLTRLAALSRRVRSAADAAQDAAARDALSTARQTVPVRTGALRSSLTVQRDGQTALAARRPYARFVEAKKPYLIPALRSADFPGKLDRALKEALK